MVRNPNGGIRLIPPTWRQHWGDFAPDDLAPENVAAAFRAARQPGNTRGFERGAQRRHAHINAIRSGIEKRGQPLAAQNLPGMVKQHAKHLPLLVTESE